MRKRFNRNRLCSSENYIASRKEHFDFLKEKHDHFCGLMVSGEITLDVPTIKGEVIQPEFKTIRIFGKEMKLTIEEYNTHYLQAKL